MVWRVGWGRIEGDRQLANRTSLKSAILFFGAHLRWATWESLLILRGHVLKLNTDGTETLNPKSRTLNPEP